MTLAARTASGNVKLDVTRGTQWMYHAALFSDVDGDGDMDLLTVRTDFKVPPLVPRFFGQLLWLENPGNVELSPELLGAAAGRGGDLIGLVPEWREHLIDSGAEQGAGDVNLVLQDLDGDGKDEILTTHFFRNDAGAFIPDDVDPGGAIVIYSTNASSWAAATYPASVQRTRVAGFVGGPFDLRFADANGDGKTDLVTTNHVSGDDAVVVAYEIPVNWKTALWPQHVLARGFTVRFSQPGAAAPGTATPFYPTSWHRLFGRKWIVVSGDGTGSVHLLVPKTARGWTYDEYILLDTALDNGGKPATVGSIAVDDTRPCALVHAPLFETGQIATFDFCKIYYGGGLGKLKKQTSAYFAAYPKSPKALADSEPEEVGDMPREPDAFPVAYVVGSAFASALIVGSVAAVVFRQREAAALALHSGRVSSIL